MLLGGVQVIGLARDTDSGPVTPTERTAGGFWQSRDSVRATRYCCEAGLMPHP
jgi:hypothetical protein